MKKSTIGIGIVFLVIAVGAGVRLFSEEPLGRFFSPAETRFVEEPSYEIDHTGLPSVPAPLPLSQPSEGAPAEVRYTTVSYTQKVEPKSEESQSEPTRLVPRQENQPDSRPEYVVRGQIPVAQTSSSQLPHGRLTHKDTGKANPLREDENFSAPANVTAMPLASPQSIPSKISVEPVAHSAPVAPKASSPLPEPKPISQAAMQTERSDLSEFPTPPAGNQDSILEPAGFQAPFEMPTPPAALAKPKQQTTTSFEKPTFEAAPPQVAPQAETSSPLRSADPFAAESHTNALPPITSAPQPQPVPPSLSAPMQRTPMRAESVGPIASAQEMPIDRPANGPTGSSLGFGQSAGRSRTDSRMNEGTGLPGASALEGSQTPHLTLEKVLPPEIIIEQPATIKLKIRNTGRSTAKNITVLDRVPQGARLLSTTPETSQNQAGELVWSLGSLDPNEELGVEMRILPLREGEIGSVATVNYTAEASARIQVARPMLQVDVKVPSEVRLGEVVNLEIVISNPGTATASGIVLVEHIPDGLYHKDGKVLENRNIDTLKPKEKKILVLPLTCTGSGNLVNHLVVTANNNLSVEEKTTIRALSPVLDLSIAGPKQRFLERKATYKLVVSNTGNASAQNVDLKAVLPKAVKFVSTNQNGVYEAQTHTVHWALEELPAQEAGEIELIVLPSQIGEHPIRFTGAGQNNLKAEDVKTMTIDGLPALSFEVVGNSNLVEVGKEVEYEIRVANRGTKSAENVRIQAALSDGMTFVKAEGATSQARGSVVAFSPIAQLEAKGEKTFKITARCNADGDHRISVQVVSDDLRSPITKEESTRVFQ